MPNPRPLLSVDIDGVLARLPRGWATARNLDTSLFPHPADLPASAPAAVRPVDRLLQATYFRVRYARRSPMLGAADALAAAQAAGYRLIALTGRDWRGRPSTERWLARHDLFGYFEIMRMNDSTRYGPYIKSARFKEAVCAELGVARHIEDDPATAALLARAGVAVDLIDWPRSRGLEFPTGVTRRRDLVALTQAFGELGPPLGPLPEPDPEPERRSGPLDR